MIKSKPKECVNSVCRKVFFVSEKELCLPLQCESCIEEKVKNKEDKS
jgi:hypothetical protein